jgi:signal transduction histidine kinase
MGLIGIEERVRELHGTFDVGSHKPSGTDLRVTIPVILSIEEAQRARAVS